LENTVRLMEKGLAPLEATLESAKEISFTILSMTISLAAVFFPLVSCPDWWGASSVSLPSPSWFPSSLRLGFPDAHAADVRPPAQAERPRP